MSIVNWHFVIIITAVDCNCLVAVGENGSGKSNIHYGEYVLVILTMKVLKCNIKGSYLFPHI
jgi:hypothetical protein